MKKIIILAALASTAISSFGQIYVVPPPPPIEVYHPSVKPLDL